MPADSGPQLAFAVHCEVGFGRFAPSVRVVEDPDPPRVGPGWIASSAGSRGDDPADGLDAVEWDRPEGHDVAGLGRDDPFRCGDGDADVAVVVSRDAATVEDQVAGSDRLFEPVDVATEACLGVGVVGQVDADLLIGTEGEAGAVEGVGSGSAPRIVLADLCHGYAMTGATSPGMVCPGAGTPEPSIGTQPS